MDKPVWGDSVTQWPGRLNEQSQGHWAIWGWDLPLQAAWLFIVEHMVAQLGQQSTQGLQAVLLEAQRLTRPLHRLVLFNGLVIGAEGLPASPWP